MNPSNVALLTTDQIEAAWEDTCPTCKVKVSALKHDFHLCSMLASMAYRVRQLEKLVGFPDISSQP